MARPKGEGPPKVNVGTRIPRELYDQLEAIADAEKRTVSQVVWFAIDEYLRTRAVSRSPESPVPQARATKRQSH